MNESTQIQGPELPALGIVESLSDEDRALLCSYGEFRYVEKSQIVIGQGQPQECLFFVISGELHAKRKEAGRETLLGTIRTGESFGEVNIFDPGVASATVIAMTPAQIWKIDRASLDEFFQAYPVASVILASRIASVLARRLRWLADKLEQKSEFDALLSQFPA